jgi:hypothetical protein
MRAFHLYRLTDVTGVSGTGKIAEGVQFSDGRVAMRWLTVNPSTTFWDSIEHAISVHGHDGKTEVRWLDEDANKPMVDDVRAMPDTPANRALIHGTGY